MYRYCVLIVIVLVHLLSGCATYKPMPLTPEKVSERLAAPDMDVIRVKAQTIDHPLLSPVQFNHRDGLSPDEAAILAVLANPSLTTARNQRGLAQAQLIEAGILPNPELSFDMDFPKQQSNKAHPLKDISSSVGGTVGEALGNAAGTAINPAFVPSSGGGGGSDTTSGNEKLVNAYAAGLQWEVTSLIPLMSKLKSARANAASVDLDIAWQEWQTAESAKLQVYRLVSLEKQLILAREMERELRVNLQAVQKAVAMRNKTIVEQAAAQTALDEAHITTLELEQEKEKQRLDLNKTLGVPPTVVLPLEKAIGLPVWSKYQTVEQIMSRIADRRLDLIALKMGYESQEEKLRTAVLEQFPQITLGVNHARDTSNIITTGFTSAISLPVFDRNQAAIATEHATRQQLFDEYIARLYDARAEIARILADIDADQKQIQANKETLAAQNKLVQLYGQVLQQGNADVLSYYNARVELIKKRIDVLKLESDLVEQSMALELAAGEYFEHGQTKESH